MNVSLTPQLEAMIQKKVEAGLYNSASEVVREALRLLEEQDRIRELRMETLRKEVQLGIDQIERGEFKEYDSKGLKDLANRIKSEGRKRLEVARKRASA
jgi:antitoxin ParD1/3/4